MLNKGLLKNVMSHGAKSLMLVTTIDVVNIEKQKEINENKEEQMKGKYETSIEKPRIKEGPKQACKGQITKKHG